MRNALVVALMMSLSLTPFAQDTLVKSIIPIRKGVELHNEGKFLEAIDQYDQVHRYDSNYVLALYEESMSYYSLENFDESEKLARKALQLKPYYSYAMISLGNTLDEQGKLEEAISIYDEGIARYPYNSMMWLNKGVLYEGNDQYAKAFDTYKAFNEFNHMHPSVHLRLGLMALNEGRLAQGLLSLTTFLMLEPASSRSLSVLVIMDQVSAGGYEAAGSAKTTALPNEMEEIDFLIENKVALNKKYKYPSKIDFNIVATMHLVFSQLSEQSGSGYWWGLYAPIYQKILDDDKFTDFAIYLNASSTNDNVQKELDKNLKDVKEFRSWWVGEWLSSQDKFTPPNQQEKRTRYYNDNSLLSFSDDVIDGELVGEVQYFFPEGQLKSFGKRSSEGKRQGTWFFLFENGDTNEVYNYSNGLPDGEYKLFHENGKLSEKGSYAEGKRTGGYAAYHQSGEKYVECEYVDGKINGAVKRYHPNGALHYDYSNKEGMLDGEFKQFNALGTLVDHKFFSEDKLEGERKRYYADGKTSHIQNYVDNQLEGDYETYFDNGQLDSKGKAVNGSVAGEWLYYYRDGKLREKNTFGEKGKVTGIEETYANDGKLLHKREYQKGDLIMIEAYDADGKLIYSDKLSKGVINVENYTSGRRLMNTGQLKDGNFDGNWIYSYPSGVVSLKKTFNEGLEEGMVYSYHRNGELEYELNYKKGKAKGSYSEIDPWGVTIEKGHFGNNARQGPFQEFYFTDVKHKDKYYVNGVDFGVETAYWINGNISYRYAYDDDGLMVGIANYDTNGVQYDSSGILYGTGKLTSSFKNGKFRWEGNYLEGMPHGDFRWSYPNGSLSSNGVYNLGYKTGEWINYYVNGQVSSKGSYTAGQKDGEWIDYNLMGRVTEITPYVFGSIEGLQKNLYANGKSRSEIEYLNGERHGESRYYAPSGELKIIRYYQYGLLVAYSYLDASGKLKDPTPIENESADIVAFYQNGQKSVEYQIIGGWFEGKFTHYTPEGKLLIERVYENNEEVGLNKRFHGNGKLKIESNHQDGRLHGSYNSWYENGKPKIKGFYKYGQAHGLFQYYDNTGKSVGTILYNSDVIVE